MKSKTLTLLGFASKAGKLSFGMAASAVSVKKGKAKLLLCAGDVSVKSQKELNFLANKYGVPVRVLSEDMQILSSAVGKACGIIAVNDGGFAQSISSQEETQ